MYFFMFRGTGLHQIYGNSLLGKILTHKKLIYLLNFLFYCIITAYHLGLSAISGYLQLNQLKKNESPAWVAAQAAV